MKDFWSLLDLLVFLMDSNVINNNFRKFLVLNIKVSIFNFFYG